MLNFIVIPVKAVTSVILLKMGDIGQFLTFGDATVFGSKRRIWLQPLA